MNYFIKLLQLSCLVIAIGSLTSSEMIPVLIWDSTQATELIPALKPFPEDRFQSLLTDRIGKDVPLLVFAEENLSLEDFSLYDEQGKSVLSQMSTLKTSDHITYCPFTNSPMSVIQALPGRKVTKLPIEAALADMELSLGDYNIVIINMNDATDGEDRIDMLKRHDAGVVKIYEMFSKLNKEFVALFTGYHSSWTSPEDLYNRRQTREVEGGEGEVIKSNGSIAFIDERAILFVNSTPMIFNDDNGTLLENLQMSTNLVNPEELHVLLSNPAVTLDIFVLIDESYWTIPNISVVYKDKKEKNYAVRVKEVYAPNNWSYHCTRSVFPNLNNTKQRLEFPGFQFQPFNSTNNSTAFGDPYDCVTFMTIPILSGIFITIILVLIMTFGLTIIMSIKTMDRFDDPKGKTITINASD